MKLHQIRKYILWLLGMVLLGAIGSGAWERILSPLLTYLSGAALRAIGSVSESFKDSIYYDAAEGFHEEAAHEILSMIMGGIFAVSFFAMALLITRRRRAPKAPTIVPDEESNSDRGSGADKVFTFLGA